MTSAGSGLSTVLLCRLAGIDHGSPAPPASRRLEEGPHSARMPWATAYRQASQPLVARASQVRTAVTLYRWILIALSWTISWAGSAVSCPVSILSVVILKEVGESIREMLPPFLLSPRLVRNDRVCLRPAADFKNNSGAAHRKTHRDSGKGKSPIRSTT